MSRVAIICGRLIRFLILFDGGWVLMKHVLKIGVGAVAGLGLLLGLGAVGGCSLENQAVLLAPQLTYKAERIGRDQPIYLNVVDKRSSKLIGYRKDETKDRAEIVAANDLKIVVESNLKQILTDNGFLIAASADASVGQFTIEIDELSYKAGGAYVAPSIDTRVLLKGTAKRGATTRSNNYDIRKSGREARPLTADRNAKLINEIVSAALTMVAEDKAMLTFLATAPGQPSGQTY